VVQPVECPTLGFGSGHDLRVVRSSPVLGFELSEESTEVSLPLPALALSLSLR